MSSNKKGLKKHKLIILILLILILASIATCIYFGISLLGQKNHFSGNSGGGRNEGISSQEAETRSIQYGKINNTFTYGNENYIIDPNTIKVVSDTKNAINNFDIKITGTIENSGSYRIYNSLGFVANSVSSLDLNITDINIKILKSWSQNFVDSFTQDQAISGVLTYASKNNNFKFAGLSLTATIPDKSDTNNIIAKVVKVGLEYNVSITSKIAVSDSNSFKFTGPPPEATSKAVFDIKNDGTVNVVTGWGSDWTLSADYAQTIATAYLQSNNTFVFLSKTYTVSDFTLSQPPDNPEPNDFLVVANAKTISPDINLPDDLNNISSTISIKTSGITAIKNFGDNLPKTYNQDLAKNDALIYVASHNTFSADPNNTNYTVSNFAVKSAEQQSDSSFTVTITGDVTPKSGTDVGIITLNLSSDRTVKVVNDWALNSNQDVSVFKQKALNYVNTLKNTVIINGKNLAIDNFAVESATPTKSDDSEYDIEVSGKLEGLTLSNNDKLIRHITVSLSTTTLTSDWVSNLQYTKQQFSASSVKYGSTNNYLAQINTQPSLDFKNIVGIKTNNSEQGLYVAKDSSNALKPISVTIQDSASKNNYFLFTLNIQQNTNNGGQYYCNFKGIPVTTSTPLSDHSSLNYYLYIVIDPDSTKPAHLFLSSLSDGSQINFVDTTEGAMCYLFASGDGSSDNTSKLDFEFLYGS